MKNATKLERFFNTAVKSEQDVLITRDQEGTYKLFNTYSIKDIGHGTFSVTNNRNNNRAVFSSLKIAMAWCTLHNEGMHIEANHVSVLDSKLISVQFDIDVHKKMVKLPKNSKTLIYVFKLQQDNARRRNILQQINTYINSSKRIQARKFSKPNKYTY